MQNAKRKPIWGYVVVSIGILALLGGGYLGATRLLQRGPACPTPLAGIFTVAPIDPASIVAMQPYGRVNGQDHILPVDHMGISAKFDAGAKNGKVEVRAPADLTITKISSHIDYDASGKAYSSATNYIFETTVCRGLYFWAEWVQELAPTIAQAFTQGTHVQDEGPLNEGGRAVNDNVSLRLQLKAGDLLGWAGTGTGGALGLAVSAFNYNLTPRADVQWGYYNVSAYDRRYLICFTDLYAQPLRDELTAKYGEMRTVGSATSFVASTHVPPCGEVMQNETGTIKGDWFIGDPPKQKSAVLQSQGKTLSFITDSIDGTQGVISVGGTVIPNAAAFRFSYQSTGTVNVDFAKTQQGTLYCYEVTAQQVLPPGQPPPPEATVQKDHILAQLVDAHHVKVEYQKGTCTGTLALSGSATTYQR